VTHIVIEELKAQECLAHLTQGGVGRVAVSAGALPAVYSVFFAFSDGHVVLRMAPKWQLREHINQSVVAFNADGFDKDDRSGWSVLVRGVGHEVTDPALLAKLLRLPLRPWGDPPEADCFLRIPVDQISGTHFREVGAERPTAAGD
jgi:nitroimidazol reductase NimA-like FMN-containing flavoprotein (pyridoxamine 5'-phosphate oxidase superfamily)